jgi:HlyD family secretion protein
MGRESIPVVVSGCARRTPGRERIRPRLAHVVLALAAGVLFSGCGRSASDHLQGYIEGEFVYVASPFAGQLVKLEVQRGAQVKAGDPLFALDREPEQAARDEAERRLAQAHASLDDAKKGKRPSEIDAVSASLKQAETAHQLAETELARQEKLLREGGGTTEQAVDQARSARDQNRQRAAQLAAELETARLGARPDQVAAAEANMHALEAVLARAEWNLAQKRQTAAQAGLVFDTLYREGEWVAAGRPAVVLLPPQNIKLRVYVPETRLGSLHVGDTVQVSVDGAGGTFAGRVSYISAQAEYTPPVIYSRENRKKFVYLVEAHFEPAAAAQLHPGQPADVQFNPAKP